MVIDKTLPKHVQTFAWFENIIFENIDSWPDPIPTMFPTEPELRNFIRYWMLWNIERGFLHVWLNNGEPVGGIICRPCEAFDERLLDIEYFERGGDSLWVDFLYAPGLWSSALLPFLKATGKKYGGWYRRDNAALHTVEINKLKESHFKKSTPVQ